jgi:hypothetical protein
MAMEASVVHTRWHDPVKWIEVTEKEADGTERIWIKHTRTVRDTGIPPPDWRDDPSFRHCWWTGQCKIDGVRDMYPDSRGDISIYRFEREFTYDEVTPWWPGDVENFQQHWWSGTVMYEVTKWDPEAKEALLAFKDGQKTHALIDSGASHVMLPTRDLPKVAEGNTTEITISMAVGSAVAQTWRQEVYAPTASRLIPLGRLLDRMSMKMEWTTGDGPALKAWSEDTKDWKTVFKLKNEDGMAFTNESQTRAIRTGLWAELVDRKTAYMRTYSWEW